MNICAGIILYNPEIERLVKNVNAIKPQVNTLILVDNASDNIDEVQETFKNYRIVWIKNTENKGMSGALNQLTEYAANNDIEWLLTLDDDSVCGENMVAELLTSFPQYDNIAVVSPRIIDRDIPVSANNKEKPLPDMEEINMCITAGSLTNVKAVIDAGGYDERLFIDHVDHDMCLRLIRQDYKIIKVNTAVVYQEFGKEAVRRRFLWKTYTQRGYTPFRVYYQTRNSVYMLRKYGREFDSRPRYFYFYLIFAFSARLIYEPKRIKRLKAFITGYIAGLSMKIRN